MSIDETLSRSSTIQEMSWKAERTMSIVLAKHLIGVTQHPSTIIVRVVDAGASGLPRPLGPRPGHLLTRAAPACMPQAALGSASVRHASEVLPRTYRSGSDLP